MEKARLQRAHRNKRREWRREKTERHTRWNALRRRGRGEREEKRGEKKKGEGRTRAQEVEQRPTCDAG